MIGNDIVDLALARKESNWRRPGYLEKIFTNEEQFLISNAKNPEIMVWNLWSRKEAAYKIYNRQTGIRAYIPTQLACVYDNENSGSVQCHGNTYYTKTEITKEKIHTVAVTQQRDFSEIKMEKPLAKIHKKNGIPFVNYARDAEKPISISHHGRFIAWVAMD
ncbi:MAG TPA: 4'-phosphopantetheinyl transferase superfamily protein [Flavobacterium sp.]|uniref:4'-phosphopantetheinyl transferase family protein n=1 Tax=Flavobacterium sp. TaxID=239 RepID=UPI002F416EC4